ncbi:MAG: hypothetical protein LBI79_09415 [Nitrososphaerota archaeon]|jgi:hypothetical protein|nr:hypothetical protein [Nitrososphaerota archaeon]
MRKFAWVAIILVILVTVSAVGVLGEISSGVKTGDWITYQVSVSGYPPADHDLKFATMDILEVEGVIIHLSVTSEFANSTTFTEQITLNLDEGILGDAFFIPSNLNTGDQFYDVLQGNLTITGKQTRLIAGAERPVVLHSAGATRYIWDRETGALVYARSTGQNFTIETSIDKTNMWRPDILNFKPSIFYPVIVAVVALITILSAISAIWIKQKKQRPLLLTLEATGAVFTAVFLVAYLGGMLMTPSTTVLHSELPVRITLFIVGAALLVLILASAILILREKTLKSFSALKAGLLIVALAYFLFNLHSLFTLDWIGEWERAIFGGGSLSTVILIQDISSFVGIIARFIAGIIALVAVVFYLHRGLLSTPRLYKVLRWILVLEAIYWLALIPTAITLAYLAMIFYRLPMDLLSNLAWTTLPLFVESMVLPFALLVLAKKIGYQKPPASAIKWAWISGVFLIVVFWLTNMGSWMLTVGTKGTSYLIHYPQNLFSFIITVGGLIALALYTAYFAKKKGLTQTWQSLNLRGIGAIITLLGLYFLWNYLNWIFFGGSYIWSNWYAWSLGHNLDLWMLTLPLVGIPLMLYHPSSERVGA